MNIGFNRLLSVINVQKNERSPVQFLILQAFFTGIFNSSFFILAHSYFLKSKYIENISEAFILSGFISLFMVFVFHLFVSSFKFKSAKTVFSILVGILTMSLLSVQYFMKIPRYEFYLFVSVFPIQIITIQKFNATLNYYFPRGQ